MSECNATLTTCVESGWETAERTDLGEAWNRIIADGVAVVRRGDRLMRLDLHTLTCDSGAHRSTLVVHTAPHTSWTDDTPGATPHRPTVEVTDAEVEAAARAWVWVGQPDDDPDEWATLWAEGELNLLRAALVAAKQAAQETRSNAEGRCSCPEGLALHRPGCMENHQ